MKNKTDKYMKKFKMIACANTNMVIGNNGDLIYHIPSDLKNFKRMTIDNVIIMGRKTFESLPNGKPLPNRVNIIVTNNENYCVDISCENVYIVHSLEEAYELCVNFFQNKEWFIIGGGTIYNQALEKDLIDTCYLTIVNDVAEGDTTIPNLEMNPNWHVFYRSNTQRYRHQELTYYFTILKRIKDESDI